MKQATQRIAELEAEEKRREGDSSEAVVPSKRSSDPESSSSDSESSSSSNSSSSGSDSDSGEKKQKLSAKKSSKSSSKSKDSSSSSGSEDEDKAGEKKGTESGAKDDEEEYEADKMLSDYTMLELKTQLGQARHALKKAQDDVVYVTFFPVKDHRYISLYPKGQVLDLKLRTQIRRKVLSEHSFEDAQKPEAPRRKWEDREKALEEKRSGERDARLEALKRAEFAKQKSQHGDAPQLNRKQRRALAADAAAKLQFGRPDEDSGGENEDFFFETKEQADAAAVVTSAKSEAKIAASEAAQRKESSEKKEKRAKETQDEDARRKKAGAFKTKAPAAAHDDEEEEFIDHSIADPAKIQKVSFSAREESREERLKLRKRTESIGTQFDTPEDDTITAADFFGDDYRATGRLADEEWEAQQERAQRTGDRKFRFMPNAPEYLTSRGKKRARDAPPLPSDGFTKKPWHMDQERDANQGTGHRFNFPPGARGRGAGGARGGRGGSSMRGGSNFASSRGGGFSGRGGGAGHSSNFSKPNAFGSKPSFSPSKPTPSANTNSDEPQKKKRSRPKSKKD